MNTLQRTKLQLLVKQAGEVLEKVSSLAEDQFQKEAQQEEVSGPAEYVLNIKDLRELVNEG